MSMKSILKNKMLLKFRGDVWCYYASNGNIVPIDFHTHIHFHISHFNSDLTFNDPYGLCPFDREKYHISEIAISTIELPENDEEAFKILCNINLEQNIKVIWSEKLGFINLKEQINEMSLKNLKDGYVICTRKGTWYLYQADEQIFKSINGYGSNDIAEYNDNLHNIVDSDYDIIKIGYSPNKWYRIIPGNFVESDVSLPTRVLDFRIIWESDKKHMVTENDVENYQNQLKEYRKFQQTKHLKREKIKHEIELENSFQLELDNVMEQERTWEHEAENSFYSLDLKEDMRLDRSYPEGLTRTILL